MSNENEIPHGDFHEVWWIYSPLKEPWAGLRIAHFRKTVNDESIFIIQGEIDPKRIGVRVWVDVWLREGWCKIAQIPIPTADQIRNVILKGKD